MNQLRVAVDVGSRFHRVAVGDESGRLLEEFRVDHRSAGFEDFFARIDRYRAEEVRVAMEATTAGRDRWISRCLIAVGACTTSTI